jgi:hypothetical protein
MDLCRQSKNFGNIWLLIGVLFSVCVFVGTPKIDEYLAFYSCYLQIKKNEYTNKNGVILYAYPCIGPDKSLFWQHKYTKDGCKGIKPSHKRKTVFVYLCIGVSGQRNHSLRL